MPGVGRRNVGDAMFWRPIAQGDPVNRRWLLSLFLLPALALLKRLGRRDTPVPTPVTRGRRRAAPWVPRLRAAASPTDQTAVRSPPSSHLRGLFSCFGRVENEFEGVCVLILFHQFEINKPLEFSH
jgi:hypothetical protein